LNCGHYLTEEQRQWTRKEHVLVVLVVLLVLVLQVLVVLVLKVWSSWCYC
jgi:predicted nucleic acid-binding Zn ribbon protein